MLPRLTGEKARFDLGQSVSAAAPERRPERRKVSRQALLLIKSFEGFRPRAVRRRDGVLTIGYGHTRSAREGVSITEAEAELLLQHDLLAVVGVIHDKVARPLSQNQFDALVSFIFNIGPERFATSDVLERLNEGAVAAAGEALAGWPDRAPPATDAPYRRRSAERALFDMPPGDDVGLAALLTAPVRRPGQAPDDAPLGAVRVLRHEKTARPQAGSDWSDTGAVLFIGCVGLLVVAAAIAAFQRALAAPAVAGQSALTGGALSVIGLLLVGVAAWNFWRGRPRASGAKAE